VQHHPQTQTPQDPENRESLAGIQNETRQSDSNIGSTRKQEEEIPPPPPQPKTTEDPYLACNTNISDLLWQCS
jgi:hypothetical protein